MQEISRAEHSAWLKLCELLQDSGAVSVEDLNSRANGPLDSRGKVILESIREWARLYHELLEAKE